MDQGSSRARPDRAARSNVGRSATACTVQCDLCEAPFQLPPEIASQGVIHGLLVCTQCVEDELLARACCGSVA